MVRVWSARGSWTEKVEGLNAGADDYVSKPSHVQEIVARLRALMRRAAGKSSATLVHNDIELSPALGSVSVAGKPVELTAQELRILNYFMHRHDRLISQNELIEHLYPFEEERDPMTEEAAFRQCIIDKTRRDMKNNPHLYGVTAQDADRISFEFLGKDHSPDDDPSYVRYRFRYVTAAGPYCLYSFPDRRGGYLIHGASLEADTPSGQCFASAAAAPTTP